MKKQLQKIIDQLKETLDGEPWFGNSVYNLLRDVSEDYASVKPNENSHSLVELIYHMYTWADFTLKRIRKEPIDDMDAFEKLDWREIDPMIHGWEEGLSVFIATNQELITLLETKDDSFLNEKVDYRDYDFQYLLNGLIHHNIYHAGQIAYVKKLLS